MTDANAVQAVAYALAPIEQLLPAQSLVINAASFMRAYGVPQWTVSCSSSPPVSLTITFTDRDGSGNVTAGDVVDVPPVDCSGLRRKLTFTLTQLTAALDQIAGRLDVDIEADGIKIVGSLDALGSYAPATRTTTWQIANAMITLTKDGTTQTVRITSGQFAFTQMDYTFTITGGSVESGHLGGDYTFATITPLSSTLRRLPSSGELLLSTSSGSRVRVTPPTMPGNVEEAVEYAVAGPSSASFGPAQQTLWTAIVRGVLFGWRPNEAPTLTNLQIQPANPSPGTPLYASYNAQDINGDPLETTVEWRRNGTVIGGNTQSLNVATTRNDQISVTVTVSDGRLQATATTSITVGNPPPVLTLTVTPPLPDTTVNLTAVANVVEPDGDPVTLTYEWTRDGSVVGTAAILPASVTTRGDTISLRVTASDGVSTVAATSSVTIADAPPRVTVASPPTTVAHGAPVTFTATVTDADGDAVGENDFLLAYGPSGMTVDPDTGVVTWTPTGPMFDREMDVNWGIIVDGAAEPGRGTLRVTDPARDYPLMRTGMQIPVWPSGLSLGDLDNDGDREMLIMAQRWLFELESDGAGGYRQTWAYPYALNVNTQQLHSYNRYSLATGDVDGDSRHEIFAASGRTITKLDGERRRPVATRELAPSEACADLALADLDRNGDHEVVCLISTIDYWTPNARMLVLRATDLSIRHEFPPASYGRSLSVGNVDSDSALEIVTAAGYVFDGASFANQWLRGNGFGMDVDTGNVDGSVDGIEEIIAAHEWQAVRVYRSGQQTPIAEVARGDIDSLHVVNVTGDSRPEIIVGDGQGGNVTIFGYNTVTSGLDFIDEIRSQDAGVSSIGVGNLDADAALEIVWGTGGGTTGPDALIVVERNPTLQLEWRSSVQLDGPFRGGPLAGSAVDARAPLFLSAGSNSGYAGPLLVRMPADGGNLRVSSALGWSYSSVLSAPNVVDYDNDGDDEVFLAMGTSYYDPLFRIYDFFGGADVWTSGVTPNQQNAVDVAHADVTSDGNAELIGLTWTGTVYVYDVFQQSLWWQSPTLATAEGRRVLVADVDGAPDGRLEIVVATARNVYVYRHAPQPTAYVQAAMYQTNREIYDAAVGDTDGDGAVEVVLLLGDQYVPTAVDVARLDNNLEPLGSFTLPWSASSLAIEPAPEPRKNLLIGRTIGPIYGPYEGTLALVDARTGGIVFESPPLIGAVQRNSVHYVKLPGETRQRISIGTSGAMYLTR